ncbi:hypothetical protein BH23GEM6_BH23GEM6_08840 [soil metagenome]
MSSTPPEVGSAELDEGVQPPISRMAIAVLALIGLFISGYLTLYNYGLLGVIQCGAGGCLVVQSSAYAWFPPRTVSDFGVPVAMMGIVAYTIVLLLAMLGVQPRYAGERWIAMALFGIAGVGVAFSAWLTYLEAAVIRAWCQWCVVSAILVTLIFLLSISGFRAVRGH